MKTWIAMQQFRDTQPCVDGYRWFLKNHPDGFFLDDVIEYLKNKNEAWADYLSMNFYKKPLFPGKKMIFDSGDPDESPFRFFHSYTYHGRDSASE